MRGKRMRGGTKDISRLMWERDSRWWMVSADASGNALPHPGTSQTCGFSCVCVRMCYIRPASQSRQKLGSKLSTGNRSKKDGPG